MKKGARVYSLNRVSISLNRGSLIRLSGLYRTSMPLLAGNFEMRNFKSGKMEQSTINHLLGIIILPSVKGGKTMTWNLYRTQALSDINI